VSVEHEVLGLAFGRTQAQVAGGLRQQYALDDAFENLFPGAVCLLGLGVLGDAAVPSRECDLVPELLVTDAFAVNLDVLLGTEGQREAGQAERKAEGQGQNPEDEPREHAGGRAPKKVEHGAE